MPTEIVAIERRRKYHWPDAQLNLWMIVMIAGASLLLGAFAYFMTVQNQMNLGIPWLFPYMVTVASLTLAFICLIVVLIAQRQLLPGIVLIGSFILFVLWLTGLIETAIQEFGPTGGVNGNCQTYVLSQPFTGVSLDTLQWLEQQNICNLWSAAFAFEVVGCVFWIWMMVMAYQVNRDDFD